MTLQEYLETNPSRKDVGEMICKIANMNCLHVEELHVFNKLSDMFNLTLEDFYDDKSELTECDKRYGINSWKFVGGCD